MIGEIFEFWKHCSRHERARMDDKRAKEIGRALRWGYTPQELRLAILGCCADPWYNGQNDRRAVYTHLGLILRDADHVDKFVKLGEVKIWRDWNEAAEMNERISRGRVAPPASWRDAGRKLGLVK